jgi:hypothetical protein
MEVSDDQLNLPLEQRHIPQQLLVTQFQLLQRVRAVHIRRVH